MPETPPTIHDVGFIQPFASVIAYRAEDETIVAASGNLAEFVQGIGPEKALGQKPDAVLGASLVHAIRNAQALPALRECPELLGEADLGAGLLEASAFALEDLIVVDLMMGQPQMSSLDLLKDFGRLSERMQGATDTPGLLTQLASLIRIMSGYDRVQAVRAGQGNSCTVIAESRRGSLPDNLGVVLPCPEPVAAQPHPPYHYIQDVNDVAVPILGHSSTALELCLLPSSQPRAGRLENLATQGMQAELVLPLSVEGQLWGALLFQHRRPRAPTPRFRQTCRAIRPLLEAWLTRFET